MSIFFSDVVDTIFTFLISFINLILTPIDNFITTNLPDLTGAFELVSSFWSTLSQYAKYVITWTGFYNSTVSFLIIIWTAIFTIPLIVNPIKRLVIWFSSLKV